MNKKFDLKYNLENLAKKYETESFIKDDPIQFPHRFKIPRLCETLGCKFNNEIPPKQSLSNLYDIEIAAFISSLMAYGNRKVFVKKLDELFKIMQNKPYEFVLNFNPESLKNFNYRFAKDIDFIEVFNILNKLYKENSGLKKLFKHGYQLNKNTLTMMQVVADYFYTNVSNKAGQGFYHLIPNPKNGGAMKRMNMFLRWMVRKGPVDLGVWDFIPEYELLIPLDVHVARISREMGLLKRSSNDFKAVLELSNNLKQINPKDPIKFDFAMFGLGIETSNTR